MKSPIRLMQLEKDYQRHKILRRIKKRRKRLAESALKLAERWFRRKINRPSYDGGKDDNLVILPEYIVTPDSNYTAYLNSLPDNQKYAPSDEYDLYSYWKMNGEPANFLDAISRGMFSYNKHDKLWHANSITWKDGVGYFMKPKSHPTVHMETDWFNKGLIYEDDGSVRKESLFEKIKNFPFRTRYLLQDDPTRNNYYIYSPKFNGGKDNDDERPDQSTSNPFDQYTYDQSQNQFSLYNTLKYLDWWYSNRNKQIENNLKESGLNKRLIDALRSNVLNSKWTFRGDGIPENFKNTLPDIYLLDLFKPGSAAKLSLNPGDITNVGGFFVPNWKMGTDYNVVNINTPIMPFLIHEATHSQDPLILNRIIPKHLKLRKGVSPNDYLDNPDEINSRLMELRYINNLDPNKKYTIDDIRKMGTDYKLPNGQVRSTDILNRYDDSTLLWLINELAYNENNLDLLYANKGKDLHKPVFDNGKDDDVIYENGYETQYVPLLDIGLDPVTGEYVDNKTGNRGSLRLPEFTLNWDRSKNRPMTSDEVTANFYRKNIPYSSAFDGSLITAPTDWLVENVVGPTFNAIIGGFANYGTTPLQLADPQYLAFMLGQTQKAGELLSYTLPSKYLDTGNTTLNFAMDMLAGKYAPKVIKAGTKYVGRKTTPIWMPWMLDRGIKNATNGGRLLEKPMVPSYSPDINVDFDYRSSESELIKDLFKQTRAEVAKKYLLGEPLRADEQLLVSSDWENGVNLPFPEDVVLIIQNSVLPRMLNIYKRAVGGVLSYLRAKEMPDWVTKAAKDGYYRANDALYNATLANKLGFSAGYYTRNGDYILLRNGTDALWALPHEFRHKFDNKYPLKFSDLQRLRDAYGHMKNALLDDPNPEVVEYADNYEAELPTTNLDARTELIGKKHAAETPVDLQNKIIDKSPDDAVIKALEKSNGYGRRLVEYMRRNNLINPNSINNIREAMKWVGAMAAPVVLSDMLQNNNLDKPEYKRGKGIHINPANRGKFNATKKRTGKTTELLTHSKNPLTRKRAIFAQNAKKWKHK